MKKDHPVSVPLRQVTVTDSFWGGYMELARTSIIPYQWEALNDRIPDAEPSHCIHNFRVAAGEEEGSFEGCVFQDSDLAKWLEGAAYSLSTHPDEKLEKEGAKSTLATKLLLPFCHISLFYRIFVLATN